MGAVDDLQTRKEEDGKRLGVTGGSVFFFQAEDGIRDVAVTGVQTCALPIAGRFARDAEGWIAEARSGGRQPIVVGGTGLYIRALADGLFREPPFDPQRREQLRHWSESLEGSDLARWAGRLDQAFLGGGRQRAARAVEVALLTGHALSWWQRVAREHGTLRPWYIHLTVPREVLHRRLGARVDQMLAAGLVAEA